jgi:ribonuclease J
MGMPLVNPDRTPFDAREAEKRSTAELIRDGVLHDIPSLYQDGSDTALLISHAHQDHYGLMSHKNPSCPVWLGVATKHLIELINSFTGKEWNIQNPKHFKSGKMFKIGDMKITPYLMDHAAFDAYAFLIESGGKSLFYTGDFRLHGRKSNSFDWFSANFRAKVDYLLLEGSTIGRGEEQKPFQTESELEEDFVKTFKETKGINLVYVSGQNIDRLVTIYQACRKTHKIFLIDFYIANVLYTLNKRANNRIPFPSLQAFRDVKVYYPKSLTTRMLNEGKEVKKVFKFTAHKISKKELDDQASNLVMTVRPSVQRDLERYLHKYTDGCFIYSMYDGYKDKPGQTKDFLEFIDGKGMPIIDIHTSGHADLSGLKKMVQVVKPKHIVPIHTFEGDSYARLFPDASVKRVADGETVEM